MAISQRFQSAQTRWITGFLVFMLALALFAACSSSDESDSGADLSKAADQVDAIAGETIEYTINIEQTIPVETELTLNQDITIPIDTTVEQTVAVETMLPLDGISVPIETTIPLKQDLVVPVILSLADILPGELMEAAPLEAAVPMDVAAGQVLPIDTRLLSNQNMDLPVSLLVDQDYVVETEFLGQAITVPINLSLQDVVMAQSELPLEQSYNVSLGVALTSLMPDLAGQDLSDLELVVPIPTVREILALIPPNQQAIQVNVPISIDTEIPISLDAPLSHADGDSVSVSLEVPLSLPLKTEVTVPLNEPVSVSFEVPVSLEVPVQIPLSDTSVGPMLQELADTLRGN